MKRRFLAAFLVVALGFPAALAAQTTVPEPVQRQLAQKFKTSYAAGTRKSFWFSLYDATGQVKVWEEGPVSYRVAGDRSITHQLGSVNRFADGVDGKAVDFTQLLVVEAAVRGTTSTKAFRVPLKAAPYALGAASLRMVPHDESPNLIGGGSGNRVASGARGSVIVGGGKAYDPNMPEQNEAFGDFGFIGGGLCMQVGDYGFAGGGATNHATGMFAAIGGGENNTASNEYAAVLGGKDNMAAGTNATVGGGGDNQANGSHATVAGGAGGRATGENSTIAGGCANAVSGYASFVAGEDANGSQDGMFVWSSSDDANQVYEANGFPPPLINGDPNPLLGPGQFWAKAPGGVFFVVAQDDVTGDPIGAKLVDASGWQPIVSPPSDANLKTGVEEVDARAVLEKVAALPVRTWSYKGDRRSARHIGPMAQDFSAAFGVGEDRLRINPIDGNGVSLAAIQGLYAVVRELQGRLAAQERELAASRAEATALGARLEDLRLRYAELRTLLAGQPPPSGSLAGK